jgi:hypothetical protein
MFNPPDRAAIPPATEFRPLPLLGNPHLQTIIGNLLPGPELPCPTSLQRVPVSDGDCLLIHDSTPARWRPGLPIAVLVHGLGGSHRSAMVLRMAERLLRAEMRVVRVDLRSAGKGVPLARRPYHAGCSGDVRAVLETVGRWSPGSPLHLLGFSLGGNIVLKLAGEAAAEPVAGLSAVAAVAPPVDLARCSDLISLPCNRIYEQHFLRELVALVRRRQRCFPALPPVRFPRPLTLREFDDVYTAPRCGFAGAADYYCRASSLPLLPQIRVPTLILAARDDPFIAVEPLLSLNLPRNVDLRIVDRGGHLGFIGRDGNGGLRWGDRFVVEWLARRARRKTLPAASERYSSQFPQRDGS